MLSVRKTAGNTTTGVHMLQRHGSTYRFKCNVATLTRFTSTRINLHYLPLFGEDGDKAYLSEPFDSIEDGAAALCAFVEKVCGVKCDY